MVKGGKKGKGKAKGKNKTPTVIEGISTEEMTKEQLEEHIVNIREELDREREERNYFQLERDKINTFWEITKRQLDEKKAELRNKDREMEDSEERHQVEIKVMKQKVKHLLYEHQNNLAQLKSEAQLELKLNNESNDESQSGLRGDKRHLKISMKEQELSHEDVIRNLKKVRGFVGLGVCGFVGYIEKKVRGLCDLKFVFRCCLEPRFVYNEFEGGVPESGEGDRGQVREEVEEPAR